MNQSGCGTQECVRHNCELAFPAEYRERRAGALAHHGFEGNARYVDPFPHFGVAQQALYGVGHALGGADKLPV